MTEPKDDSAEAARDAAQKERERVESERGGPLPKGGDRSPW